MQYTSIGAPAPYWSYSCVPYKSLAAEHVISSMLLRVTLPCQIIFIVVGTFRLRYSRTRA